MVILMILFVPSTTQHYLFQSALYLKKTIKNYKNFLAKDLKDQSIGTNIKQKVKMNIQQMNKEIFLDETLQKLTDCLFWFI